MNDQLSRKDRLMLGSLTTRNEDGRHFMARYSYDWLQRMESLGYITIIRPVHRPTGIPYSEDYWEVEVSPVVATWFDDYGNLIGD
jgi:hypothetical protein